MTIIKLENLNEIQLRYAVVKALGLEIDIPSFAENPWFVVKTDFGERTDQNFFKDLNTTDLIKQCLLSIRPTWNGVSGGWLCETPKMHNYYGASFRTDTLEKCVFCVLLQQNLDIALKSQIYWCYNSVTPNKLIENHDY